MSDAVIDEIFLAATDLPESQRQTYVETASNQNPDIITVVQELLRAHENAKNFFAEVEKNLPDGASVTKNRPSLIGRKIGPYRLIRLLGEGGMGGVYLATRSDDQFEQQVAIKILPIGMQFAGLDEKFFDERRILASLNHKNIAMLLDGGISEDGTPYFVMEYVSGEPITRYCDARRLTIEQRLILMKQVLDAISYAHRNFVAHRDIKPENILVTDDGQIKLLDFGIAKILGDNRNEATLTVHRLLTPAYASPEQLRGEVALVSCDVYALGVLMYELLCGNRPYTIDQTNVSRLMAGKIHHQIAPMHKRFVNHANEPKSGDTDEVAALRSTTVRELKKQLSTDINSVVFKAMMSDASNRYETVQSLADDVDNVLRGLPVLAKKPTVSYRVKRFLLRNKLASLAGTALVFSAIVITALSYLYAVSTKSFSERVQRERDRAQQMTDFLIDIFDVSDPNNSGSTDMDAKTLLKIAGLKMEQDLARWPASQAAINTVIGRVYSNLAIYDESESYLKNAIDFYHDHPQADIITYSEALAELSTLQGDQGKHEEAMTNAQKSIAILEQSNQEPLVIANRWANYSEIVAESGDYKKSLEAAYHALELIDGNEKEEQHLRGVLFNNLGTAQNGIAEYDEAAQNFARAIEIYHHLYGDVHPDLGALYSNLSNVYVRVDKTEEAKEMALKSLSIRTQLYGPRGRPLMFTLNNLGTIEKELENFNASVKYYDQAIDIAKEYLGPNHPNIVILTINKINAYYRTKEFDKMAKVVQEIKPIANSAFPTPHLIQAKILQMEADILMERQQYDYAMERINETIAMLAELHERESNFLLDALKTKIKILIGQKNYDQAQKILDHQKELIIDMYGEDSVRLNDIKKMAQLIAQNKEKRSE